MVVADGMKQALLGVALGLGGAVWLTRDDDAAVRRTAGDPVTLATVAALLLVTAARRLPTCPRGGRRGSTR